MVEFFEVRTTIDDRPQSLRVCMTTNSIDNVESAKTNLSIGKNGFNRIYDRHFAVKASVSVPRFSFFKISVTFLLISSERNELESCITT